MFHVALYEPEIPPNTGNIIRLCANSQSQLHLIHPLGFSLDEKHLRRAGLDYHDLSRVTEYENYEKFSTRFTQRIFAISTKGSRFYHEVNYQAGDCFLFGPETRGLPSSILNRFTPDSILRIPMQEGSRSLNLANAASVVIYEAWRQLGFSTLV